MRQLVALLALAAALTALLWFSLRDPAPREDLERGGSELAPRAADPDGAALPVFVPESKEAETSAAVEPAPAPAREPGDPAAQRHPITVSGILLEHPAVGAVGRGLPGVQVSLGGAFTGIGNKGRPVRVETGADGRFRFDCGATPERPLRFDLWASPGVGLRPVSAKASLQAGQHTLDELVLHAWPHGELEGRVLDENGDALEGVTLEFEHLDSEVPIEVESDERGVFRVMGGTDLKLRAGRFEGGRAITLPQPRELPEGGYEPLTVVVARTSGRLRITCSLPDGTPLAQAFLSVSVSSVERQGRFGAGRFAMGPHGATGFTDKHGVAQFDEVWAGQKLSIGLRKDELDADSRWRRGDELVFAQGSDARAIVVEAGGELELRAVLGRASALTGLVLGPGGEPAPRAEVALFDLEQGRSLAPTVDADEEGRFALEVPFAARSASGCVVATRVPGAEHPGVAVRELARMEVALESMDSSSRELVLHLRSVSPIEDAEMVRLVLEVACGESEIGRPKVLCGRLQPWDPREPAPELGREQRVRAPGGWPFDPSSPRPINIGSVNRFMRGEFVITRGIVNVWSEGLQQGRATIELQAGLYWFAGEGRDADGNSLSRVGTGLVRLEAGQYSLRFELLPTAPLGGRLRAPDGPVELHVALARGDGELIELGGDAVHELGANGRFHFPSVPVGTWELRAGGAAELRAGRARYRRPVVVPAGGVTELELSFGD